MISVSDIENSANPANYLSYRRSVGTEKLPLVEVSMRAAHHNRRRSLRLQG